MSILEIAEQNKKKREDYKREEDAKDDPFNETFVSEEIVSTDSDLIDPKVKSQKLEDDLEITLLKRMNMREFEPVM